MTHQEVLERQRLIEVVRKAWRRSGPFVELEVQAAREQLYRRWGIRI
jgi:hypothetical protein